MRTSYIWKKRHGREEKKEGTHINILDNLLGLADGVVVLDVLDIDTSLFTHLLRMLQRIAPERHDFVADGGQVLGREIARE
jgi:hypothetical protein